jgi:hypothetical protein
VIFRHECSLKRRILFFLANCVQTLPEGCVMKTIKGNAKETVPVCNPQTRSGVPTTLTCSSAKEVTIRAGWDDKVGGTFMLSQDCKYVVNGE